MLNHKHNACKSKSKILLLALCIFGLVFSYSCSCRNSPTNPDNTDPKVYTPATTLSRTLMVVKSDGSDTSLPIGITVSDASYTWEVSGDLTTDTFEIVDGNLKVKQEKLADITADKKTATLTVNYQKLPTFKENDTLSKESDTFNIEVVKATAVTKTRLDTIIKKEPIIQVGEYGFITSTAKNGTLTAQNSLELKGNDALDPNYFISELKRKFLMDKTKVSEYGVIYTDVTLDKMMPEDGNAETISFKLKFILTPEYDGECYYVLELKAVSSVDNKGKWSTQK